jgi:hypothetical protein
MSRACSGAWEVLEMGGRFSILAFSMKANDAFAVWADSARLIPNGGLVGCSFLLVAKL